jgi:hypothetical protein
MKIVSALAEIQTCRSRLFSMSLTLLLTDRGGETGCNNGRGLPRLFLSPETKTFHQTKGALILFVAEQRFRRQTRNFNTALLLCRLSKA